VEILLTLRVLDSHNHLKYQSKYNHPKVVGPNAAKIFCRPYRFVRNVYISGYSLNSAGNNILGFWKDEVWTELTDQEPAFNAYSTDIFIDGSDVYIAGSTADGGNRKAAYWKNNSLVELNQVVGVTDSSTNSILMVDGDLYIAANARKGGLRHAYYKNGVGKLLPDITDDSDSQPMIFVRYHNGVVYIVGGSKNAASETINGYWKDEVWTALSGKGFVGIRDAVFIDDDPIFCGSKNNDANQGRAGYWSGESEFTELVGLASETVSGCMDIVDVVH
jgi:hypothetical protein